LGTYAFATSTVCSLPHKGGGNAVPFAEGFVVQSGGLA